MEASLAMLNEFHHQLELLADNVLFETVCYSHHEFRRVLFQKLWALYGHQRVFMKVPNVIMVRLTDGKWVGVEVISEPEDHPIPFRFPWSPQFIHGPSDLDKPEFVIDFRPQSRSLEVFRQWFWNEWKRFSTWPKNKGLFQKLHKNYKSN